MQTASHTWNSAYDLFLPPQMRGALRPARLADLHAGVRHLLVFMLANGDSIEIGNTTFRFDNPNGVPRNAFHYQFAIVAAGHVLQIDHPQTNFFSQSNSTLHLLYEQ